MLVWENRPNRSKGGEMAEQEERDAARRATTSGIPLDEAYGPQAAGGRDTTTEIGAPGSFPYTRGVQSTMYRGRLWTMRQYAGFSTAAESNARYRYLLEQGQTGLSVAFDLPTQMGYDSDAPEAEGEVGRVGVAIDSLADMEALFAGIPLDRVSTSMTINATAPILLALYVAVGERQGVAPAALAGTTQNDLLKEYIARGTYIFPPAPSLRLVTDVMEWCATEMPKWNTISISGYHMREAGATAAQELAFTFANGIAYVEGARARGIDVDTIGPRLSFFFASWTDILEEVAKFRAARRIWARIMRDRFGATSEKSMMCRFHVQTAGSTLTAQSIDNNVVRASYQALAAILGGAQSLHVNGKDEALALPTEAAARLALRTQQIVAHESGVAGTVDPLGGSYAVEALTDRIEADALALIAETDRLGGMVAAISSGFPQRAIQDSAFAYQREIERGDRVIVGVNRFIDEEAATPTIATIDPAREREQVDRLVVVRAERDAKAVEEALVVITAAASGTANMMPPILAAVKVGCTVGEISNALRAVWGEHREGLVL